MQTYSFSLISSVIRIKINKKNIRKTFGGKLEKEKFVKMQVYCDADFYDFYKKKLTIYKGCRQNIYRQTEEHSLIIELQH